MVIYVKDGFVHHLKQKNHSVEELVMLMIDHEHGVYYSEPIPYPVNKFTIYWEYIKMNAIKDRVFFGPWYKWFKANFPESPIIHRFLVPYYLDNRYYNYKGAGRQLVLYLYLPIFIFCLFVLYLVWRMFVACLCRRK